MNQSISTETDRRAYEAAQNIHRLSSYQHKCHELSSHKNHLAQHIMKAFPNTSMCDLEYAINIGWHELDIGMDISTAIQTAKEILS